MRYIEASIKKRSKDSFHGISFKYNNERNTIEVLSIEEASLFSKTPLKDGDEIIVMDGISFKGNVVDKMKTYVNETKGDISIVAKRFDEEPKNKNSQKDSCCDSNTGACACCIYVCQDCECSDGCTIS